MIVAPLMTPILGIVLAVVLADRANLRRCVVLVMAGAAAVVVIGWLVGLFVPYPVVAATNARVTPRIVDLVAALATGAVGSVALARSDISDTLPGVTIAISLVPPLAVVGLTLESGTPRQSPAAFVLFVTNVAAILASGIVVMAFHRVHRVFGAAGTETRPRPHPYRSYARHLRISPRTVLRAFLSSFAGEPAGPGIHSAGGGESCRSWVWAADWVMEGTAGNG
jgi:uncharacterized hydrophobic protein (TIGR00271 family)